MKADRKGIRRYVLKEIEEGRLESACKKKGFRSLASFLRILAGFNKADKGESPIAESS
jgi:hypothetical protein